MSYISISRTKCGKNKTALNVGRAVPVNILFIPSNLGYGENGAGNVIPPNANIIFEIEMLETLPPPVAKQ